MQNEIKPATPAEVICPYEVNGNSEEWAEFMLAAYKFAVWANANEGWPYTHRQVRGYLMRLSFTVKATSASSWLHLVELLQKVPASQVDGEFKLQINQGVFNTPNAVELELWLD